MRETINKAKFTGKTIVRKFIAMSLVISIGFYGVSLGANAQSGDSGSDSSYSTSSQPPQGGDLSQNGSDDFSCCFNFFCFFPAVILTIFRILAGGAQRFAPTSSKDK